MNGILTEDAMKALSNLQAVIDEKSIAVTAVVDYDCTCDGACNPE